MLCYLRLCSIDHLAALYKSVRKKKYIHQTIETCTFTISNVFSGNKGLSWSTRASRIHGDNGTARHHWVTRCTRTRLGAFPKNVLNNILTWTIMLIMLYYVAVCCCNIYLSKIIKLIKVIKAIGCFCLPLVYAIPGIRGARGESGPEGHCNCSLPKQVPKREYKKVSLVSMRLICHNTFPNRNHH